MGRRGAAKLDLSDPAGAHAERRLRTERVIWMTTVDRDGTPQPSPVWFLWDGESFLVYSLESPRVRNLGHNDRVALNLDGNGLGGDIVIVEGTASVEAQAPTVAENGDYLAKYGPVMAERGWDPEWFGSRYKVPIRVVPTRFRYW